jgi:PDZ domain-containing protein
VPFRRFAKGEKTKSAARSVAGWTFVAIAAAGLIVLDLFQAPYVIERPGPVVNVLGNYEGSEVVKISDVKTYATTGALDLLSVSVVGNPERTPSWVDLFWAWLDPAQAIVPVETVYPKQVTLEELEAESTAMMEESQQDAVAVALLKLGYEVASNVYVSEVTKNRPAAGKLVAGDFVTAVDGQEPTSVDDLRRLINLYDGSSALEIEVLRKGKTLTYEITPTKNEDGAWVLGIFVGTTYDFPVEVDLSVADIGGPSGGMMFALGIYDKLTQGSLTRGKNIAGTGTISVDGTVGPIGGIRQKMYGAVRAGATHFLAPVENCGEVSGHVPSGLTVVAVSTFDEALKAVEQISMNKSLSQLGSCSAK